MSSVLEKVVKVWTFYASLFSCHAACIGDLEGLSVPAAEQAGERVLFSFRIPPRGRLAGSVG